MAGQNFRAVIGHWELDSNQEYDVDGTDAPVGLFQYDVDQRQTSLDSTLTSSGQGDLRWLIGAFVFEDQNEMLWNLPGFLPPLPGTSYRFQADADVESFSYALYGQLDYEIKPNLTLTVGLRYSEDEKEITESSFFDFGGFIALDATRSAKDDWSAFTPKVSLSYQSSDDLTLYLSASKGYKAGGFNGGALQSGGSFEPEFIWSYEGGVKSRFMDGRITTNLAAFYSDYEDLQLLQVKGLVGEVANAGKATIWGLESEVFAQFDNGIGIDFATTYLVAEFDEFITEDAAFPALGAQSLRGNKLPRTPELAVSLGVEYMLQLEDSGSFKVRAE